MNDLGRGRPGTANGPARKRQRATHACDLCRRRKIRCDGRQPCATCIASQHGCIYGAEASPKGKSDLILDGVLRMERYLHEMSNMIATNTGFIGSQIPAESAVTPRTSHSLDLTEGLSQQQTRSPPDHDAQDVHNAILSSLHTSTTESILEWPHFDIFPSIRQNYIPVFQLEQSRSPLTTMTSAVAPYLRNEEVRQVIEAFQSSVNFFYPTMSQHKLDDIRGRVSTGNLDDSVDSCLALLIMALGCASQAVGILFNSPGLSAEDLDYQQSQRRLAEVYFDGVLKRLHTAHLEISTEAIQCLFFVALYFAYLQRPLQAWSYINTTATRCRLLLSYTPSKNSSAANECVRRIFWSCYILESDYLAELSALPQSGIADIESSIPLPGQYNTRSDPEDEELSSLYFLACLSMRRLLNRVHDLLYARNSGAGLDDARFPLIVTELDHQLEEWRELLPHAFRFTVDTQPTPTQHGGFLRQRYLTCRSVIYRPYLTWVLSNFAWNSIVASNVIDKCEICLNACLLHILNLKGYCHTAMIDTWICSLSMTGGMLILLAACRVPSLRERMGVEITTLGAFLKQLIEPWMRVPGGFISPSVEQSLRMIGEVDDFIKREYQSSGAERDSRF